MSDDEKTYSHAQINDEHSDVSIAFGEDKKFKCHRAILSASSEYFHTLFSSDLEDGQSDCLSGLQKEIEAAIFHEVLQFIYSDTMTITSANAYQLLHASDYLGLQERFQNSCINFITENIHKLSDDDTVKIYEFACLHKKLSLSNLFYPRVVQLFQHFSTTSFEFLKMPFDDLVAMLSQCTSVLEDVILQAIIRWVRYNRKERCRYISELCKSVQVTNLSISFMRSLLKDFVWTTVINEKKQQKLIGPEEANDQKSLYVYIYDQFGKGGTRIFSVNENTSLDWAVSSQISSSEVLSVAFSSGLLYTFDYSSKSYEDSTLKFFLCTSVEQMFENKLTSPEFAQEPSWRFDFCGMEENNVLYLYDKGVSSCHNIFSYSCLQDRWSTDIRMETPVYKSSMTACSNRLYFIGGEGPNISTYNTGFGQAYDYREPSWCNLPPSLYSHKNAASCAFEDKIYVCNPSGIQCEFYDIRAGKWSVITSVRLGAKKVVRKIIPFSKKLWLFSEDKESESSPAMNFRVHLYDPEEDEWSNYSMLNRFADSTSWQEGNVIDAVVFNPWV